LRVATGHDDPGVGVFPVDAADSRAGVLIGGRRYGAGVENDDPRLSRISALQSPLLKLAFNGGAVRLGCATAEIFHVESGHVSI